MKELKIIIPDEQAEIFAEKLAALVKEHDATIETVKNADIFNEKIPEWERFKTVEDAIRYTGIDLPDNIEKLPLDVQAYLKLRIVCAAYNGLTITTLSAFPLFTTSECRYYPRFYFYTQEEIDQMDADEKSRVLGRSNSHAYAYAGVAYSYTNCASSGLGASSGGRLCFKTEELATECGKRFAKLWGQFFGFLGEEVKIF